MIKKLFFFFLLTISIHPQVSDEWYWMWGEVIKVPTTLTVTGGEHKLTITTNETNIDSVRIYLNGTWVHSSASGSVSWVDSPLVAGTVYSVTARNKDGIELSKACSSVSDTANYLTESDAFFTRVVADGGTVVSKSAVDDTVFNLQSRDEWDDLVAIWGYNYGVKKDGSNLISTLYDIKNSLDVVSVTTARPTWYADSIFFDGGDQLTIANSAALNLTDKITIYANVRSAVTAGNHALFANANAGADGYFIWFPTGTTVEWNTYGVSTILLSWTHSNAITTWAIYKFQYDKDGGTNNKKIISNGTTLAQSTKINAITASAEGESIGALQAGSFFSGSMKEVRIWNGIH